MKLEPEVITTVRRITDRFIRLGKSTPVHEIKSDLGAKRRALDALVQDRVIQQWGETYLPCLRAVTQFEDRGLQKLCFGWTEIVLRALKLVYVREGRKDCNREQVADTVTRMMEIRAEPEAIRVGMLFAIEFSGYFGSWISDASGGVSSIRVTEGILDFDTIELAWQNELHKRSSEAE